MRKIVAVTVMYFLLPSAALACSYAYSPNFTEVTTNLAVSVRFEDKPLARAEVTLNSWGEARFTSTSSFTQTDGIARLSDIPPGKYYVKVDYLGIRAAWDHIEVRDHVSAAVRPRLEYRWGEAETTVRRFAGKMKSEGSPPNSIHRIINHVLARVVGWRVEWPIVGAPIRLRHPTNGSVYDVISDRRGEFAIPGVPDGTYVMEVLRGKNLDIGSKFLIRVSSAATKDSLQLKTSGGFPCGIPSGIPTSDSYLSLGSH